MKISVIFFSYFFIQYIDFWDSFYNKRSAKKNSKQLQYNRNCPIRMPQYTVGRRNKNPLSYALAKGPLCSKGMPFSFAKRQHTKRSSLLERNDGCAHPLQKGKKREPLLWVHGSLESIKELYDLHARKDPPRWFRGVVLINLQRHEPLLATANSSTK